MVALGAGIGAAWTRRSQLRHAIDKLGHPAWGWLFAALVAQAVSMVVFARLQRWLLRCGGVRVRLRDMVEITLAGNALSTSLPGGAAWAAGWVWGQLRRRSVDRVLAGWVVLVAGALSSFALFLYVVVGAEIAGSHGPVASLRWVDRGLLALAGAALVALVALARSQRLHQRWRAVVDSAPEQPRWHCRLVKLLDETGHRVRVVSPTPLAWAESLALALVNWGADLATLVFCVLTLHASVPWRGIVVAYALTQIAASVPITPGGLVVVEASLTALLTAYGLHETTAVIVVLLYRLISFWVLVPIGWTSWAYLELRQRRAGSKRTHPWAVHHHRSHVPDEAVASVQRSGEQPAGPPERSPAAGAGSSPAGLPAGGVPAGSAPPGEGAAAGARGADDGDRRLDPDGFALQGPERVLRPKSCDGYDGCDEPLHEPVSTSHHASRKATPTVR